MTASAVCCRSVWAESLSGAPAPGTLMAQAPLTWASLPSPSPACWPPPQQAGQGPCPAACARSCQAHGSRSRSAESTMVHQHVHFIHKLLPSRSLEFWLPPTEERPGASSEPPWAQLRASWARTLYLQPTPTSLPASQGSTGQWSKEVHGLLSQLDLSVALALTAVSP